MSTQSPYDVFNHANPGTVKERRAEIEHEESLARAERNRQLEAQRSTLSTAGDRIRLWEKLHKLHLPRTENHALLAIIAKETGLEVIDIQREQRRRTTHRDATV